MPSKIEWTEEVWNPVTGCTKISLGCKNCYAERIATTRLRGRYGYPVDEPFRVTLHPDKLDQPLKWRKPRVIFVCSMGDLFHKDVEFDYIDNVMATIACCQDHKFIILTKRIDRMAEYFAELYDGKRKACSAAVYNMMSGGILRAILVKHSIENHYPNIYPGVSCEDQATTDERIPILLQIPAAHHIVSLEPLLSGINIEPYLQYEPFHENYKMTMGTSEFKGIDQVILGCESGSNRRRCYHDWVRNIVHQCDVAGKPLFVKQIDWKGKVSKNPDDWPESIRRRKLIWVTDE